MNDPTSTRRPDEHRFYGDLAPWWPLISPPEEYAEEAAFAAVAARRRRRPATHGAGAGQRRRHTRPAISPTGSTLTLVDLSEPMLAVSRGLNPDRAHHSGRHADGPAGSAVRRGADPRRDRLHDHRGRSAAGDRDGVRPRPARRHRRAGARRRRGDLRAAHRPRRARRADGRAARYLEWSWDPDPADSPRPRTTPSCSARRTARSRPPTRPTGSACSRATPGCGC